MKTYRSLSSIPECARLPQNERRRRWRRCYWQAFKGSWTLWAGLITFLAFWSFGLRFDEFWGSIIGAALGGFIFFHVVLEAVRPCVREELRQSGMQKQGEIS
jgi:hypothetical protein